ncbi:MAG: SUF system NifU family Fe-S cluster assembly protein [Acidobacteria bacterium]|nr:SUF system NifU family Fe-S cluster assembly protein [Acidobacteriota bacterium]
MPSDELDDLYRETILDHYRAPRGAKPLPRPDLAEDGLNPLCGDEVTVQLAMQDGRISDISVQSRGCSISVASGSLLAQQLKGLTVGEAERVLAAFKALMHGDEPPPDVDLGDIEVLGGVRNFPVRVKCALLPWTTLEQALARLPERP